MRKYRFTSGGFEFARIDRKRARAAYNNGLTVIFCPVNLHPFSPWGTAVNINKSRCENRAFENVVNEFEYYNIRGIETGRYTAFYIPVERVNRFTGETPTAATLGTVEQYNYKYMEG